MTTLKVRQHQLHICQNRVNCCPGTPKYMPLCLLGKIFNAALSQFTLVLKYLQTTRFGYMGSPPSPLCIPYVIRQYLIIPLLVTVFCKFAIIDQAPNWIY